MEREVTRCEKHGLHYDAKLTRGCVICKRETREAAAGAGGADAAARRTGGVRASSFAGLAVVVAAVAGGMSTLWKDKPTPAAEKFSMKPPPGWQQVDPKLLVAGAGEAAKAFPAEHKKTVERIVRELSRKKNIVAAFINLSDPELAAESGWVENINVTQLSSAPFVDNDFVAQARVELPKVQAHAMPGVQYRLVGATLFELQGAPSLRIAAEGTIAGVALRFSQFLVPGGDKAYMVTATARAEDYKRWEPVFDAAARTIRGAKQGVKTGFDFTRVAIAGAIGAGASLLFGLVVLAVKRRRAGREANAGA